MSDALDRVMAALGQSVDRAAFARSLGSFAGDAAPAKTPGSADEGVTARLMLSDVLDDGILAARPQDPSFPLRLLLSELATRLPTSDDAMALAGGLNLFLRADLDEETRTPIGLAVSRAYYRFAQRESLPSELVRKASPLLAQLLSTQVERVRFESVDHTSLFDSKDHERSQGSNTAERKIRHPDSFLLRVSASALVRTKAAVTT